MGIERCSARVANGRQQQLGSGGSRLEERSSTYLQSGAGDDLVHHCAGTDIDIGRYVQQFHVALDDPRRPFPSRRADSQTDLALTPHADGSEQLLQEGMADRATTELDDVVGMASAKT